MLKGTLTIFVILIYFVKQITLNRKNSFILIPFQLKEPAGDHIFTIPAYGLREKKKMKWNIFSPLKVTNHFN